MIQFLCLFISGKLKPREIYLKKKQKNSTFLKAKQKKKMGKTTGKMHLKLQGTPESKHFLAAAPARFANKRTVLLSVKKVCKMAQKLIKHCKRRRDVTYLEH